MSSYLNSLVARQLNRDSLVRPRLPALFEPPLWAGSGPSDLRAAIELTATIEPPAVEPLEAEASVVVQPESRRPINPPSHLPAPAFPSSIDQDSGTVYRGRQLTPGTSLSAEPTRNQPGGLNPAGAVPQPPAEIFPSSRTQPTSATIKSLAQVPPEKPTVLQQSIRQSSSSLPAAAEQQNEARDQATPARPLKTTIEVATSIEATEEDVEPKGTSRVVQPRVLLPAEHRRAATDSVKHTQSPMSEPAPVINVTIGRIEVRATTPATPRRQPAAKPLMSLDEYLQRRTRGGGGL